VANSLLNRDRAAEAVILLKELAAALTKDGHLDGAKVGITGSGGRTLQIETTALAVLGWLKANRPGDFTAAVRSAVEWLGKQRGSFGGYGSTQSTILTLKALIAHTKATKQTPEAGELSLVVGDRVVSKLAFAAGAAADALTLAVPDADKVLKPGANDVRVEVTGKNTYPYTLAWSYHSLKPASSAGCAVKLTTGLDRAALTEGESVRLNVKLENVSGKGQGMAVAVIGLPAGLKLPEDFKQLKDLARLRDEGTKPGVIGAFEVRGRELVLYWRDLAPDAAIDVALDLTGDVPGEYRGPASRAYLYYNADVKSWAAPVTAAIRAKQ
jgi:A-macroglobulin TED domain